MLASCTASTHSRGLADGEQACQETGRVFSAGVPTAGTDGAPTGSLDSTDVEPRLSLRHVWLLRSPLLTLVSPRRLTTCRRAGRADNVQLFTQDVLIAERLCGHDYGTVGAGAP